MVHYESSGGPWLTFLMLSNSDLLVRFRQCEAVNHAHRKHGLGVMVSRGGVTRLHTKLNTSDSDQMLVENFR